jgi:hypothetical protein
MVVVPSGPRNSHSHVCYWCGEAVDLTLDGNNPLAASREHLIPGSVKTRNAVSPKVLAHKQCNARRSTVVADGFKRLRNGERVIKIRALAARLREGLISFSYRPKTA